MHSFITHTRNTEKTEFWKQKVYKLISLNFPVFYVTLKINPLTTKAAVLSKKKVDYDCFKMAILVNDLRQIPSFSLLLWRFCGVFMLEYSPPQ